MMLKSTRPMKDRYFKWESLQVIRHPPPNANTPAISNFLNHTVTPNPHQLLAVPLPNHPCPNGITSTSDTPDTSPYTTPLNHLKGLLNHPHIQSTVQYLLHQHHHQPLNHHNLHNLQIQMIQHLGRDCHSSLQKQKQKELKDQENTLM